MSFIKSSPIKGFSFASWLAFRSILINSFVDQCRQQNCIFEIYASIFFAFIHSYQFLCVFKLNIFVDDKIELIFDGLILLKIDFLQKIFMGYPIFYNCASFFFQ